jgi:hypothetical protein
VSGKPILAGPIAVADGAFMRVSGLLMILQRDGIRKLGIAGDATEVVDCLLMCHKR